MQRSLGDFDQQLFDRSIWTEPLFRFAQVSRLVISLYDRQGKRWCGPCFNHSLAARLARAGMWECDGWGSERERTLVQRCVAQEEPIHESLFGLLGQLAVPCKHEGEVVLVFVLGWVLHRLPDPAGCEALADQVQVPSTELWPLIQIMQPIPEEKLFVHGQMLETFSTSLLRQIFIQNLTHRQAAGIKVLSDTAFAFAGAMSEQEICQIAHKGLKRVIRDAHFLIKVSPPTGPSGSMITYENEDRGVVSLMPHVSAVRRHISIPVFGAKDVLLGQIDITFEYGTDIEFYLDTLYALAGQLGVALQKTRLLSSLETKCSALQGANAELKRLHKVKDEFLANVSHELKTPLNAIMGWAQILGQKGQSAEDFKEAVQTIERSAMHQSRLIEELLDVSRIISGKMILQNEDLDARVLLKNAIEAVQPIIQCRKQTLHWQLPSEPMRLRGDGMRLNQVFWNLLSNASKFTQDGGHISVILESAGSHVHFEVSDSGQGIAAADIARLFDRFYQVDGACTQRDGGLGLGLAIVKHLVELHGGSVAVKSEGEGQGATFSVILPQVVAEGECDTTDVRLPSLEGIRVLLVDDEPDSLQLMHLVLQKCGAQVEMASSADEGFGIFQQWQPDVLISDVSLPGESGYELIQRIRFLPPEQGGSIPAIALTALAGVEPWDGALHSGFQLYMAKPVAPQFLGKSLVTLLGKSS